jgi:Na+/H+ antiporter NhaC
MAAKSKTKRGKRQPAPQELDSTYFLKLVLYLIVGSQWLRIMNGSAQLPIPVGMIVGLFFARHEHFQIDKKIELALLLLAMFIGFWLPIGVHIML